MAYLKPPAVTRHLANPLAMRLGRLGVATLTVVGRRTGEPHRLPVIPVEVDGDRYLVSPYGDSEWVRNLRASGTGTLRSSGRTERFSADEVPTPDRARIIARYRETAGRFVDQYFTRLPDPQDHPVFRIH